MNIVLMEPLGVSEEKVRTLANALIEAGHKFTAYDSVAADKEEMIARAKDADVLIIANHPLPDAVIEACPNLKYISVAFVGIDHVGQASCKARGIPVSNTTGYCRDAVAELALGLTLDCLRNISACNQVVRHGGTKAEGFSGTSCAARRSALWEPAIPVSGQRSFIGRSAAVCWDTAAVSVLPHGKPAWNTSRWKTFCGAAISFPYIRR